MSFLAPELDPEFLPAAKRWAEYRKLAAREASLIPFLIAMETPDGCVSRFGIRVLPDQHRKANDSAFLTERAIKFLLWQRGASKIYISGDPKLALSIAKIYSSDGKRAFDTDLMRRIYETPLQIIHVENQDDLPDENRMDRKIGGHLNGNRIGIDLGASSRTCCAVIDGKTVYSETVHWAPAMVEDPDYHQHGVMDSIRSAARHLPEIDGIGISAAGAYFNNRARVGSIFRGIKEDLFEKHISGMFQRISQELHVPVEIINDGEVTALAGVLAGLAPPVLGLALGSALGGGYVNPDGHLNGWLNELAFVPIDYNPTAPSDEWSGDIGCCVQYLSQQGAIRLAKTANITLPQDASQGEQFAILSKLADNMDESALKVFRSLGVYLASAVAHFDQFYKLKNILLLGGVCAGNGGAVLLDAARNTLNTNYPTIAEHVDIHLPAAIERKIAQAEAAASLPEIIIR
jgi:predicted NBD/HSP70 family sugar kinase